MGEPAKDINAYILDNLDSGETLSGGGLLELVYSMEDVTALQGQQLANGTGYDGEEEYAVSAYDVVNSLFESVYSWKEVGDDDERWWAGSSLLGQIDQIGALTIEELRANDDGRQSQGTCQELERTYDYTLLHTELTRTVPSKSEPFVYSSEGVEVQVPASFLRTGPDGCGDVVAGKLAVDFSETQAFPESPPSQEELLAAEDDSKVQDGLQGVLADFTTYGGLPSEQERESGSIDDDVVITFDHDRRVRLRPESHLI